MQRPNSRRYGETVAVTNMVGVNSVIRGAPISTTSTVPHVPHGAQVQRPNSQRSELDSRDVNDLLHDLQTVESRLPP